MTTMAEQEFTPASFQSMLNGWPPMVAQQVTVTGIGEDWSWVEVRMALTPQNANYFGTAWGGTLFSMLDPFLPILIDRQLGGGYAVWDKKAEIDFVRPGRSAVTGRIEIPTEIVDEIRAATADGEKLLRWFEIPLTDEEGQVVAVQRRQIYVRKNR